MKRTFSLLIATTALTAAIGVPAWSAMQTPRDGDASHVSAAAFKAGQEALPLIKVSGDDDDDDDHRRRSRHDDDDDDDGKHRRWFRFGDHDDDDDDDDDDHRRGARNPAPAGTVAPPQNGLFGTGAAPKVKMN